MKMRTDSQFGEEIKRIIKDTISPSNMSLARATYLDIYDVIVTAYRAGLSLEELLGVLEISMIGIEQVQRIVQKESEEELLITTIVQRVM